VRTSSPETLFIEWGEAKAYLGSTTHLSELIMPKTVTSTVVPNTCFNSASVAIV
jgi:hypothetical protein